MNPSMHAPTSDALPAELAELVEGLTARLKAREPVDLEELVTEHPAHAVELRRLLPAMKVLADLSNSPEGSGVFAFAGDEPANGTLGDFRLIREVGRGGMGVVYEAEQISLNRRVALKILPFAATMDPKHLRRFHNEARAAASLHHDHIVPVYGVGCERGVHYYAMQFIDGQTLAQMGKPAHAPPAVPDAPTVPVAAQTTERSREKNPERYRRIAELIAQAADALEYAHSTGVVHRDVKPANLMVDAAGKLWVTDFGLARFGADAELTLSGDLLGTLRYMSPEQALARHGLVDHRTDVYSLGATFYELLTLRPAVNGTDKQEILNAIAFDEPTAPRMLEKSIPREMETVALKCLAKNPAERYATAADLANNLRHWLADRPILAKRPGLRERTTKWLRRHKYLVRSSVAMLVLAAVAMTVGLVLLTRAGESAETHRVAAVAKSNALRQRVYAADIRRAYELSRRGSSEELAAVLASCEPQPGEEELRGFEWYHLKHVVESQPRLMHTFPAERGDVFVAIFSPDGKSILTAGEAGVIDVWDARTFEHSTRLEGHKNHVNSLVFSPDGRMLASCSDDHTIRFWDLETRRELANLGEHTAAVHRIAFSPDGRLLASAGWDNIVRLWDVATRECVGKLSGHSHRVYSVAFSPDGKTLASCARGAPNTDLRLWDVRTHKQSGTLEHGEDTIHCAFSPDGRLLAGTDYGGHVKLWQVDTGRLVRSLAFHHIGRFVHFAPDGSYLVSVGDDRMVRFWSVPEGGLLCEFLAHKQLPGLPGRAWCATISRDGRTLLTAGNDQTAKLWKLPGSWAYGQYTLPPGYNFTLGPNTPAVAYNQLSGSALLWTLGSTNGRVVRPAASSELRANQRALAFSPTERWLAIEAYKVGEPEQPIVWEADLQGGGSAHMRPYPLDQSKNRRNGWLPLVAAYAGESLYGMYTDGMLIEWDRTTGRSHVWSGLQPEALHCMAASQNGRTLVISTGPVWRPWDTERRQWAGDGGNLESDISGLSLSADGRLLAIVESYYTLRVLDVASGKERLVILSQYGIDGGASMAFSPDGRTLAIADVGGVHLWHLATGQELFTLGNPLGYPTNVLRFRSDGQALVAVAASDKVEGHVMVWEAPR